MKGLYKAKSKKTGEWVEGNLITNEQDETAYIGYIFSVVDGIVEDFDIVEVDSETICQYAFSLNSGQKVFKHDILSGCLDDKFPENKTRVEVVWNRFGWATRQSYSEYMDPVTEEDLNMWDCVCGNTLDDPELERTVE